MQSRMDKYESETKQKFERSKKNTKLYEDVYDDIYKNASYKNMEVIDTAKEINLNKLKNILDDKYDTRQYRTLRNYSSEDVSTLEKPLFEEKRNKIHDINEILSVAKSKRAFIEEAKEKQKYMEFTERNKKYDEYESIKKEEQELEDLINTISMDKIDSETDDALSIFEELKGSEDTIVTNPIETSFETEKEEKTTTEDIRKDLQKTLVKADKTFYTDSNMFTKNDFEDFSTLTNELKRSSKRKKTIIILLILIILVVIGYFVTTKYIIK